MGLVGGSIFNGIAGARNAPAGFNRRAFGGFVRLKERAPVLGTLVFSYKNVFYKKLRLILLKI